MAFINAQEAVAALATRSASLADLREIVTRFPELRPAVAAYPPTDQSLLDWLGALRDPLVDAQLAKRFGAGAAGASWQAADTTVWPTAADDLDAAGSPVQPTVVAPRVPLPSSDPIFRPEPDGQAPADQVRWAQPEPSAVRPPIQPPQPGPESPATGATPARRRVLPVVLIALLAVLLVGGGLGVAFATGLLGGPAGGKAASKPSASAAPGSPATSVAGPSSGTSTPVSPSAPSTPSPPPAPAAVVCWDGSRISDGAACPTPSGEDADWSYLTYAYPSIATHSDCEQVASTGNGTYKEPTVMWECELGDALIRYRYWESVADAEKHYGAKFTKKTTLASYDLTIGGTPAEGWIKTDKNTADGPDGIKRVVVTMWLPAQQLSMSVEGNTKSSMWAALDLVRIRPLAQILGHPEGITADEAPITAVER